MNCLKCGEKSQVYNCRNKGENNEKYRYRRCRACGYTFHTTEISIDELTLLERKAERHKAEVVKLRAEIARMKMI